MISSSYEVHPTLLGLCYNQIPHAHQIVSHRRESEDPLHLTSAAMPELAKAGHGLDPTEDLFYPFALALAHTITVMAGRPSING